MSGISDAVVTLGTEAAFPSGSAVASLWSLLGDLLQSCGVVWPSFDKDDGLFGWFLMFDAESGRADGFSTCLQHLVVVPVIACDNGAVPEISGSS